MVKANWPASWQGVKKAAIGSTTARAMMQNGWEVDAIAEKPEATALWRAIMAHSESAELRRVGG